MKLPPVGTCELLRVLSPHIPDDFINERFARQRREGRRLRFSSAQLWRVHLLVLLTRTFSFNALIRCLPEQEQWRRFAHLPNRSAIPDVRMLNDFRRALGVGGFRQINNHLVGELLNQAPLNATAVAFIDATDLPASTEDKKNKLAIGLRSGRPWERALVGRAKRVFSLATRSTRSGCGLVVTPRRSCWHPWSAGPRPRTCLKATCLNPASGIAVSGLTGGRRSWWGDMGYIHQETKQWLRTQWQIAVLTRLKADMQLASPYRHDQPMRCPQGQPLAWLNYDPEKGQQWYGVLEPQSLCSTCWQQSLCPREFAYEVARHETFLGMIPLNTKAGWKLVHSARSWIEAGQSFEKNQLGLDAIFLNSLALTWTISLLADSVALLRCLAQLRATPKPDLLKPLRPVQGTFDW